ncbi:hypothetical protein Q5425_17775 [Amycolatopsis sp. A133]|nr:hypothetical protein [Amycolatopsis sp. A133]MDQ7805597.1 hypothetical protein [Amycolatopsis sp. A133]
MGLEVVVPPSERLGEGVIGVSVHRLLEDRLLLLGEAVQCVLQLRALRLAFVGFAGVHAGQLSVEDRSAFLAEDAVGEERGDGFEECIFAQVEGLRMAPVVIGPSAVVVARSAQVVGPAVADLPHHAAAARAVDHAAEQVGPLRLRM